MDIGGVNLGGINPGEDGKETSQIDEVVQPQQFNPDAQVIPAAQNQAAAMARILKNKEADELEEENGSEEAAEDKEVEVATLGLIKLSEEKLKEFEQRVEDALYRQEQEMIDTVRTFAGNEKILRETIGSILMS